MDLTAVESSTLATIAYHSNRELWQLEFNSHALYQYCGVPATVHEALLCASCMGSYFNQAIWGKFPYSRLSSGQAERSEQHIPARRRR